MSLTYVRSGGGWATPRIQQVNYRYYLYLNIGGGWGRVRRAWLMSGGVWQPVFRVPMPDAPAPTTLVLDEVGLGEVDAALTFPNPPDLGGLGIPTSDPEELFDVEVEWEWGYQANELFNSTTTFVYAAGAADLSIDGLDYVDEEILYVRARYRYVRDGFVGAWSPWSDLEQEAIYVPTAPPAPEFHLEEASYCESVEPEFPVPGEDPELVPRPAFRLIRTDSVPFEAKYSIDSEAEVTLPLGTTSVLFSESDPGGLPSGEVWAYRIVTPGVNYSASLRTYNQANDPGLQYSTYVYDNLTVTEIDPCGL